MIRLAGEVTNVSYPPNKADKVRTVTVWIPEIEEHLEVTVLLKDFQQYELQDGNRIQISINKEFG